MECETLSSSEKMEEKYTIYLIQIMINKNNFLYTCNLNDSNLNANFPYIKNDQGMFSKYILLLVNEKHD